MKYLSRILRKSIKGLLNVASCENQFRKLIHVAATFVACCLAVEIAGCLATIHTTAFLYLTASLIVLPSLFRVREMSAATLLALTIVGLSFWMMSLDYFAARLSGVLLCLLGTNQFNQTESTFYKALMMFPVVVLIYVSVALELGSPLYQLRCEASMALSSWFSNGLFSFNPRASGIDVVLIALLAGLVGSVAFGLKLGRVFIFGVFVLIIFAVTIFVQSYFGPLAWFVPDGLSEVEIDSPSITTPYRLFSMYDTPLLLSLFYAAGMAFVFRWDQEESIGGKFSVYRSLATVLVCMAVVSSHFWEPDSQLVARKVGVFNQWDKGTPLQNKTRLGVANTGMYGLLYEDLKHHCEEVIDLCPQTPMGSAPEVQDGDLVTAEKTKDLDVLLIMVATKKFSKLEVVTINKFLKSGGRVVLVGDHTDLLGCMEPFNQIAEPHGMKLEFDSAFAHTRWWFRNLRANPNLGYQKQIWLDYGVGTGGSLALNGKSQPLLIGKFAFGDLGNMYKGSMKDAFLGNYKYEHGELLSDINLLAKADVGKGCLVCAGDSSMFQNISYGRTSRFTLQVLLGKSLFPYGSKSLWLGILASSLILIVLVVPWFSDIYAFALGSVVVLAAIGFLLLQSRAGASNENNRSGLIAILDSGFSSINRDPFTDSSCLGLPTSLARLGKTVRFEYRLSEAIAHQPEAIFLLGIQEHFSSSAKAVLDEYMLSGGTVVVAGGDSSANSANRLIDDKGISVSDLPLGGDPFSERRATPVLFVNAWALDIDPSEKVNVEVLYERYEKPVVCKRSYGKGTLVVIGDPKFFIDNNLEGETEFRETNINFLNSIFED